MTLHKRSAGRLRHRVTVYDPNPTLSDAGYPVEAAKAINLGSVLPANVTPIGGGEPLRDQQVESHITHVVEIRYLSSVKQKHHLLYGERRLNIEQIVDVNGRGRMMQLLCTELGN